MPLSELQQKVFQLLNKKAIEPITSHETKACFYSYYSLVDKKDGGKLPTLDFRAINKCLVVPMFHMAMLQEVIGCDWFTVSYPKDVCLLQYC